MGAVSEQVRQTVIETSPLYGVYEQVVDRVSAYEMLCGAFKKEQAAQVAPTQVQVSTAQPEISKPQSFMVYDPATGGYVSRSLPQMSAPVQPSAPVLQVEEPAHVAQPVQPAMQQMPVMVFDPTTGQYIQKMMTMQLDPATGNYVAVQPQSAAAVSPAAAARVEKETEKQARRRRRPKRSALRRSAVSVPTSCVRNAPSAPAAMILFLAA